MDWAEILHDDFLSGKDQVYGQNSYPAPLQYYMQRCRTYRCHFSTDGADILHDNSLGEKDQV